MSIPIDGVVAEARMLTIDEAAAYLAIPKATLYTWRTRRVGFGPRAVKVGGCLRYRRTDLDAWIESHLEAVDAEPHTHESLRGKATNPHAGVSLSRHSGPR